MNTWNISYLCFHLLIGCLRFIQTQKAPLLNKTKLKKECLCMEINKWEYTGITVLILRITEIFKC